MAISDLSPILGLWHHFSSYSDSTFFSICSLFSFSFTTSTYMCFLLVPSFLKQNKRKMRRRRTRTTCLSFLSTPAETTRTTTSTTCLPFLCTPADRAEEKGKSIDSVICFMHWKSGLTEAENSPTPASSSGDELAEERSSSEKEGGKGRFWFEYTLDASFQSTKADPTISFLKACLKLLYKQ